MTPWTVLISGASRGLGAASARIAGQMHANVALMARSEVDLALVAEQVRAEGGQALTLLGDVTDPADCRQAIERVAQTFGRLDALVNNAGVLAPIASIGDSDPEDWKQNIAVNLYGPFLLTQAALGLLREAEGRVINVSSGAAVAAALRIAHNDAFAGKTIVVILPDARIGSDCILPSPPANQAESVSLFLPGKSRHCDSRKESLKCHSQSRTISMSFDKGRRMGQPGRIDHDTEEAVRRFLNDEVPFGLIAELVSYALDRRPVQPLTSAADVLALDRETRAGLPERISV